MLKLSTGLPSHTYGRAENLLRIYLTTLFLNGPLPWVDFVDVIMGDIRILLTLLSSPLWEANHLSRSVNNLSGGDNWIVSVCVDYK